jgi:anti-sigma factor RsiW
MTSQHVVDKLSHYLDGDLSGQELDRVDSHLRTCRQCAKELDYLRRIQSLLAARPSARSPGLWDGIAPQLATETSPSGWGQFEWVGKRLMPLLAAAAVLAVAFLGGLNGNGVAVTLEDYLKSSWTDESADALMVSDAEISKEDVLVLATSVSTKARR